MSISSEATVSNRHGFYLGYPIIILLSVWPIILWWGAKAPNAINSIQGLALSLGQLAGIIGTVLFALSFLLATRVKWTERLFGGLDKTFIAHHITGGLAFIALLFHPILIAVSFAPSVTAAADLLIPTTKDVPDLYGIVALWGMIIFLGITFYFFRSVMYQRWKFIHQLLGVAFFFGFLHSLLIPTSLYINSPGLKNYLLAIIIAGLVAFTYRVILGSLTIQRFKYTIQKINTDATGITEVTLQANDKALSYRAGQFAFISFRAPGVSREWHPYTISSAPAENTLRFSVKALGDFTETLPGLRQGAEVSVEGPYGGFTYAAFRKRQVWIAGGIGVTPFLSMARDLHGNSEYAIDFYYSVRDEKEAAYTNELISTLKAAGCRFFMVQTSSQGYLTARKVQATSGDLSNTEVLLCGPVSMMESLTEQFKELGVPKKRIHREQFAMQ